MRYKWRQMSDSELRAAMLNAQQHMDELRRSENPASAAFFHLSAGELEEIGAELSERKITRYTAVAAWAAVIGVLVGLVAAAAALWPLLKK